MEAEVLERLEEVTQDSHKSWREGRASREDSVIENMLHRARAIAHRELGVMELDEDWGVIAHCRHAIEVEFRFATQAGESISICFRCNFEDGVVIEVL
jgi:hypothetical protein